MSVTQLVLLPGGRLLRHRIQSWSHGLTNISVSVVHILKNSSALDVSVPINLSIKLGLVSVNDPRETYFVDTLITYKRNMKYTRCKGNKCHPFNSRRGRLKGPNNVLYIQYTV